MGVAAKGEIVHHPTFFALRLHDKKNGLHLRAFEPGEHLILGKMSSGHSDLSGLRLSPDFLVGGAGARNGAVP